MMTRYPDIFKRMRKVYSDNEIIKHTNDGGLYIYITLWPDGYSVDETRNFGGGNIASGIPTKMHAVKAIFEYLKEHRGEITKAVIDFNVTDQSGGDNG